MRLRVGVLVNPRSRYLRRNGAAVSRLVAILGDRGVLEETPDIESVAAVARRFRELGVDVVALVGGDGTAGNAVAGFTAAYAGSPIPPFAMLRGGTMNTVANALGLSRGRPERALRRLLGALADGRLPPILERTTLVADGRCGFLFGTGVFQSFLREYYRAGGDDPSVATAIRTIGRVAVSASVQGPLIRTLAAPHVATVTVDGERWRERTFLGIAAGTVREIGLGFSPFFMANRYRGAFHLIGLHGTSADVARDLGRVWLGRSVRPVSGTNAAARSVLIEPAEEGLAYMVDGDLYEHRGPLRLEVGPSVRVLRL